MCAKYKTSCDLKVGDEVGGSMSSTAYVHPAYTIYFFLFTQSLPVYFQQDKVAI